MKECRIILVDDHSILRDGLKHILAKFPAWKVVGEAKCGRDMLLLLNTVACDLIILDIVMPVMDGLTALQEVKNNFPGVKVLMLSMLNDYIHFEKARAIGAEGFMSKEDAADELPRAIEKILEGGVYIAPAVTTLLIDRQLLLMEVGQMPSIEILTRREKQILGLIARGETNRRIAKNLKISIHTVENHRANLSEKLGSKNVTSLVRFAIGKGLI